MDVKKFKATAIRALFLVCMSFAPVAALGQTWLTSVTTIPASPSACDNISLDIAGNLPASNYSYSSSNVTQAAGQVTVDVYYVSSGFGIPAVTPFNITEPVGVMAAGSYSYTVNLYFNSNPADVMTGTFTVQPGMGGINLVNDTSFCVGGSVQLDATSPGALSYSWSNGSNSAQTTIATSGTFWVEATFSGGCLVTDTFLVSEIDLTTLDLGPDTSVCAANYLLDVTTPGASYSWHNGSQSPTFNVQQNSTCFVTITKDNCSHSDTVSVTLLPVPQVDLGPDTAICSGETLTLNAGVGAAASYTWHDNSADSTFAVNTSSTIWVVAENSFNCTGSDTIQVTVHPAPVVNLGGTVVVQPGDSVQLDAGSFVSYQWNTGANIHAIWVTHGSYSVTVTDANGCTGVDSVSVVFPEGVEETLENVVQIFPNPVSHHLNISGLPVGSSIIVMDLSGRKVVQKVVNGAKESSVDMSAVPKGNYVVKIISGDHTLIRKVLKQ